VKVLTVTLSLALASSFSILLTLALILLLIYCSGNKEGLTTEYGTLTQSAYAHAIVKPQNS